MAGTRIAPRMALPSEIGLAPRSPTARGTAMNANVPMLSARSNPAGNGIASTARFGSESGVNASFVRELKSVTVVRAAYHPWRSSSLSRWGSTAQSFIEPNASSIPGRSISRTTSSPALSRSSFTILRGTIKPRAEPHRRTLTLVRGTTPGDCNYHTAFSLGCVTRSAGRLDLLRLPPQRSIPHHPFANRRGGTSANFGRQAPRPPADFGRHGAVHDDRDGPAGEPPEDAPSGESEGRDACGDGGGQARRHGSSRPPRAPPLHRAGGRGGGSDQSVRPAGPHGPSRRSGAVRVREERELAAHDAPRRLERREGETSRGERGEAPPLLQSGRPAGDRGPPGESRRVGGGRVPSSRPHVRLRADVVSGRRERGGVRQPQGRHGHPDRGGPQSSGDRRAEGGVPGGPEGDDEPRGTPEELRPPEPRDAGALGRAERRGRLRRVPGTRRGRVPQRGLRVPRRPRDLEGRVPGEDARGADGIRSDAGSEEFPDARGPRPPARPSVVGLLRRKREVAGPLRGMVRQVLRADAGARSRSRSTRGRSTAISASCCPGSPAS